MAGGTTFGGWLKQRRKDEGIAQEELAEEVGCSLAMLRKIESGERRPSGQIAQLLAEHFHIPAGEREAFVVFARTAPAGDAVPSRSPWRTNLAPASRTNLPSVLTPLVGRGRMVGVATEHLLRSQVRLLTLTGAPGIGKTRLGLQVASELAERFEDGVYMVALASATEPDQVLPAVAQTLGLKEAGGQSITWMLEDYLRERKVLLFLDNFEQILDAAPALVGLLQGCPQVKALVTSREALHVRGEQRLPVPPLRVPQPGDSVQDVQEAATYPSIQLFVERTRDIVPEFVLTQDNIEDVVAICVGLDGLPLAIELAATRMNYLSPRDIRAELSSRLKLLTGGARDLPARQRTLRAAIEWSYNLLSAEDRALFRLLGVFADGFTVEAAESVAGEHPGVTIGERLLSLADKSLLDIRRVQSARFWMLPTLLEYALEQLVQSGESDMAQERHARYFVALAIHNKPHPSGQGSKEWLDTMQTERANMQVALDWLLGRVKADPGADIQRDEVTELALRLSLAISSFLRTRGYLTEWRSLLTAVRQVTEPVVMQYAGDNEGKELKALEAEVIEGLGKDAWLQGEFAVAQEYFGQSLAMCRQIDAKEGLARVLNNLGNLACDHADYEAAQKLYEESLTLALEMDDRQQAAAALNNLANAYRNSNDLVRARRYYEESLALYRELDDRHGTCTPLVNLGFISMDEENYGAARSYLEQVITLARELDSKDDLAYALAFMWKCEVEEKNYEQARALRAECLPLLQELNYKLVLPGCFETEASMRGSEGKPLGAARLWGAAEALREALDYPMPVPARLRYDKLVASARGQARAVEFEKAWEDGRLMPVEAAVKYAMNEC
jgi:predicted ATPase/transcriptional regulator with XRE-family HTH domain/Tfp pilus assembly protein PilF